MREIDPKVFGPGTWTTMHILSLLCDEAGRKVDWVFFNMFLRRLLKALPCGECRKHALEYLSNNPLPKFQNQDQKSSLFEWTVTFHNTVNKRLGKPVLELEEARGIYKNTEVILKSDSGDTCSLNSTESCADGQM